MKKKKAKKQIAAFFDLDKTITRRNIGIAWGEYLFLRGLLHASTVGIAAFYGISYLMRLCPPMTYLTKQIGTLKGLKTKIILPATKRFYTERGRKLCFPRVVQRLEWHRKQKHKIFILTQAFDFIAEHYAKEFGVEMIASKIEVKNGVFTGRGIPNIQEKKYLIVIGLAKKYNIDLKKSFAYSDCIRDLKMLESVGNSITINPLGKLKRIAKKRRWKILKLVKA